MMYKIQCSNCKQVMECDASILGIKRPACPKCGSRFSVNDYPSLRKLKEEKDAEAVREKERRALEARAAWEAKQAETQQKREQAQKEFEAQRPVLPMRTRSTSMRGVPDYNGLRFVSVIFSICSLLCYVSAVVSLVTGLIVISKSGGMPIVGIPFFYGAVFAFIVGVFYHAFKHGCLALRDIAINSFRG